MSKKAADLAAKKQAKQKKIAIVGFVIFLAVMGFTLPKTLKMLKGPQPIATPTTETTTTSATPADPGAPPAAATPAVSAGSAELVDTGAQPEAGEGQLVSFERFATKDPFAQQVDALPTSDEAPAAESAAETDPRAEAGAASDPAKPASPGAASPGTSSSAPAQEQSSTPPAQEPSSRPKPAPPAKPTSAVIAVNGVDETVKAGAAFPEADPVFELVSLTATEVKVGIAGGTLTGGSPTVTLKKGKKVTLVNTADGTRYELVLESLS
jgi:hypothetical protein